jgi:cbb3-type cytochrome oxidase cytochrome c subunit
MKHGPYLFLGLFFSLALSWVGMIATPQLELGNAQPTNVPPSNVLYPTPYSGEANLGRDVYRANGCAFCHTQVVRQRGTSVELLLTDAGTNQPGVVAALRQIRPDLPATEVQRWASSTPSTVLTVSTRGGTDTAEKALRDAGAQVSVKVVPTGLDVERGWGDRLSVGPDYLYDAPLMLGSVRLGPDLANIGARQTNLTWHLVHLYDPKQTSPGSTMPRYPFLFQTRPRGSRPSPDALPVQGENEVIPTREAVALATYLANLKATMPLFEAPGPLPPPPPAVVLTNQPEAQAPTNLSITIPSSGLTPSQPNSPK